MRTSDWIMRFLIFLLIGLFLYFLLFWAYPQYKAIDRQQPSRPSVSETLNQLDNGKEATLDAEDYEEGEEGADGSTLSTLKKGAGAAGALVAAGAATAKDAINKGTETLGDGVGVAKDALSSTGSAIKNRADEALAGTPSIDDLVTLKEEQAKEFEEQEGGSQGRSADSAVDSYSSTSNGIYMVVAGTYRQMINAENELKKLQKLGYNNASIAKFNNSTYASLIVDRFSSSSAAYKYKKDLIAKGMDVYVHKKR